MWCAACRADVAAELSTDNRRMLCARCHSELGMAEGALGRTTTEPRQQDPERNARELLARWSAQHLLEPPVVTGSAPNLGSSSEATTPKRAHRFDGGHSVPTPVIAKSEAIVERGSGDGDNAPSERRRRKKVRRPRLAETQDDTPPRRSAQDDLVRTAVQQSPPPRSNWTTSVGQLCAYGGVAMLTLGTVMVLSGYFGGPANYAPTGWLVSAVGQMLLFLGVVTLVSGGMEQTVDEVSWRVDSLSEQMAQLERMMIAQQLLLEEVLRRERRRNRPTRDQSDAA